MTSTRTLLCLLLLALFALGTPALAQNPPGGPPGGPAATVSSKVTVDVLVLQATNADAVVDPKIPASIIKQLKLLNFSGYSQLQTHKASLGVKQKTSFAVGTHSFSVQLLSRDASTAKLRVQVSNGSNKVLDTTVTIHRNKAFMVGGPPHGGGNLLLPITASWAVGGATAPKQAPPGR